MPTNGAGATTPASPTVIEPGPQPTSSTRIPVSRYGRKKAASSPAVHLAISARKAGLPCWVHTSADGMISLAGLVGSVTGQLTKDGHGAGFSGQAYRRGGKGR